MKRTKSQTESSANQGFDFDLDAFATRVPMLLDTPGIFYVEARSRVSRAKKGLAQLLPELKHHITRVKNAKKTADVDAGDDAWVHIIHELGRLEKLFSSTISDYMIADVLLVASAEAYINAVAAHELSTAEAQQFDKLSPVGKWLILPKMMKLKWKPSLSEGSLQEFAKIVARRNKVVHPKPIAVESIAAVTSFIQQLKLDARAAEAGVEAVKVMFQQFSLAWRGSWGSYWLDLKESQSRSPCFILGDIKLELRLGRAWD